MKSPREYYNIHVYVEQKHIDFGKQKSVNADPIAVAINDCLKYNYRSMVGKEKSNVISIEWNDQWGRQLCHYMTAMDKKVIEFINKFDRGETVEPFIFVLQQVPVKMIKDL